MFGPLGFGFQVATNGRLAQNLLWQSHGHHKNFSVDKIHFKTLTTGGDSDLNVRLLESHFSCVPFKKIQKNNLG